MKDFWCGELHKHLVQSIKNFCSPNRITNKSNITKYRVVNNVLDDFILHLLNVSNTYQSKHFIRDMCLTNSLLFRDILKLVFYDYEVVCGVLVMKIDCAEWYIPHIVLYDKTTDTIIDSSWWSNRNISETCGYFTFNATKVLNRAFHKKKINEEERLQSLNHFYGLHEDTFIDTNDLDDDKKEYYNNLLKYLQQKTNYSILHKLDFL